jgi:orotate phosphoribosyltransferase
MTEHRDRLAEVIRERALRFGDFTLASGQKSTYYIDGKQVSLHGEGLLLLAGLILDNLPADVEAVGGMAIGADPIAGAVAALAAQRGRELTAFIVRKERKERGTRQQVEGPLHSGVRVVVLEDVITTGGSTLLAIEALQREYDAEIVGVIAMVDRLQGARENLAAAGFELTALFEITELGVAPPGQSD